MNPPPVSFRVVHFIARASASALLASAIHLLIGRGNKSHQVEPRTPTPAIQRGWTGNAPFVARPALQSRRSKMATTAKTRSDRAGWTAGGGLLVLLLAAGTASAVPTSVPRDPPVPPAGIARLFGAEAQHVVRNCTVNTRTSSTVNVTFTNSFPHAMAAFVDTSGAWGAWSNLPSGATDYDCTTVSNCLHATASVRIRGCHNAGCVGDPVVSCQVDVGMPLNGPPDIEWGGVETTQVVPIGCAEGAATQFVVRLRFAGTPPTAGYPTIGGNSATERTAERNDSGNVRERTYTVTPGWTAADVTAGFWDFTVALDSSGTRDATARIALGDHCLAAPTAQVVGSGTPPTMTPIGSGSTFTDGTELDVRSANSGMALTGQQLMYNSATASFGRVTPPGARGVDTPYAWYETATGRDGLTYTSPELSLTAQALACIASTDPGAKFWLDPAGGFVTLPDSTDWVDGPLIETNVCPDANWNPGPPAWYDNSLMDVRVPSGAASTWQVELRARAATGEIDRKMIHWGGNRGWVLGDMDWSFYGDRDPPPCPDGQRMVSGVCEPCPTYDECSGGNLVTQTWCNSGSPPAGDRRVTYRSCVGGATVSDTQCVGAGDPDPVDAPCVVTCPPGERDAGGVCEPCPTYHICSGGSRISQTWCNDGNPPASATLATYQQCNAGTTVTLSACVDAGGTPPASTPCTPTCTANERLVAGVCEPCLTYEVCTAQTGSNRNSLKATRTFCDPGNPPTSARTRWNIMCRGGNSEGRWQCIGEGGLSSDPGDVPCAGDRCIYYDGCRHSDGYVQSRMTRRYYQCGSNPVQPPAPQVFSRLECRDRGTSSEVEYTRYYCVGPGGLASTSSVPANDPCSTNCTDYQACTSQSSHGANRSITTTSTYCGTGSAPADAWTANRTYCNGGYDDTRTVCVGDGGFSSDPGNQPCASCSSTERLVGGVCEPCPWYYRCNGNSRQRVRWCNAGNPPADATTASFQSCVGGSTVTTNTCVPPGGSAPADSPCAPTEGIETYCDPSGNAQTRPSGSSQDVDRRPSSCSSGQVLNGDSCCVADTSSATETYCDSSGNARTRPIAGTQDVDNRDSASDCTSRQILNGDSCCVARGTETYCDSSGNARTRPASGTSNVDNRDSGLGLHLPARR